MEAGLLGISLVTVGPASTALLAEDGVLKRGKAELGQRFAVVLLSFSDHNLATAFLRLQSGSGKQSLGGLHIAEDEMEVERKEGEHGNGVSSNVGATQGAMSRKCRYTLVPQACTHQCPNLDKLSMLQIRHLA